MSGRLVKGRGPDLRCDARGDWQSRRSRRSRMHGAGLLGDSYFTPASRTS